MKKFVIILIILISCINMFAEDLLMLIYKMQLEYSNYSFEKARFYKRQMNSSGRYNLVTNDIIESELLLFERERLSENDLIKLKRDVKKLIKNENRDYIKPSLKLNLNDIEILTIANSFYQGSLNLNQNLDKKYDLLSVYNNPINDGFVSFDLLTVYSYILYTNDYKNESMILLEEINENRGLTETERDFLYNLQLTLYSYIDGNYTEAKTNLSKIIKKEVNPNYYKYIKAMPYLWFSLIAYKENDEEKSISYYNNFINLKSDIDNERKFIVPLKELLAPMPGVFPPNHVYEDFDELYDLYHRKNDR